MSEDTQKRKKQLSRPVFRQSMTLNSLQAQRVHERIFARVSNSLFSIDLILQIIGEQEEIDQVEAVIVEHIDGAEKELMETHERLVNLMKQNGMDTVPTYSEPEDVVIEIISPLVARFAQLLQKLDALIAVVDALWLNSILDNKQHSDAIFGWQQRLFKLAGRIINIEKRARISAWNKGKQDAVESVAPAAEVEADDEVSREAAKLEAEEAAAESAPAKAEPDTAVA